MEGTFTLNAVGFASIQDGLPEFQETALIFRERLMGTDDMAVVDPTTMRCAG